MKQILVGLAWLACAQSFALAVWTPIVVAADGTTWEVRNRSGGMKKTLSGEPVYSAVFRILSPERNQVTYHQIFVPLADCQKGEGKVVTAEQSGTFLYSNGFNLSSTLTASDGLAAVLCSAAKQEAKILNENSV